MALRFKEFDPLGSTAPMELLKNHQVKIDVRKDPLFIFEGRKNPCAAAKKRSNGSLAPILHAFEGLSEAA